MKMKNKISVALFLFLGLVFGAGCDQETGENKTQDWSFCIEVKNPWYDLDFDGWQVEAAYVIELKVNFSGMIAVIDDGFVDVPTKPNADGKFIGCIHSDDDIRGPLHDAFEKITDLVNQDKTVLIESIRFNNIENYSGNKFLKGSIELKKVDDEYQYSALFDELDESFSNTPTELKNNE